MNLHGSVVNTLLICLSQSVLGDSDQKVINKLTIIYLILKTCKPINYKMILDVIHKNMLDVERESSYIYRHAYVTCKVHSLRNFRMILTAF